APGRQLRVLPVRGPALVGAGRGRGPAGGTPDRAVTDRHRCTWNHAMRSLSRLVTAGLALIGVAFGVNGLASADSGTATYNGCENVATGIIRLLPSNLPAPYNTTCNTTTK